MVSRDEEDRGGDYDCTCEDGPKRDDNSADQDPIELGQAILEGKTIFSLQIITSCNFTSTPN